MDKTACGPTIYLGSGHYFDYEDVEGSKFYIEDVARALSKQCRFAGHISEFYSIAEHSVYVGLASDEEDQFEGLLHDAPEAFFLDIVSPLKRLLPDYKAREAAAEPVILSRFGARKFLPTSVKRADIVMLRTEANHFFGKEIADTWPILYDVEPADIEIQCLEPKKAEQLFLDKYYELWMKRAKDIQDGRYADCYR